MTKYNKQYFIDKFEAIPEHQWCIGVFQQTNKHCAKLVNNIPQIEVIACCALGHCGITKFNYLSEFKTKESKALAEVLCLDYKSITDLNDGILGKEFGDTPKERILNKLKSLP